MIMMMMISETPQGRSVLHSRDNKTQDSFLTSIDLSDCNPALGLLREVLSESHLSGKPFRNTSEITERLRSLSEHTKSKFSTQARATNGRVLGGGLIFLVTDGFLEKLL